MPSGPRLRSNNVYGVITDNPLLSNASTFNSTQLILLPSVTTGHAVIVIDPKRVNNPQPEIVIVTAHTGLATVATITRAAYGTTARQHPVGTAWAHITVDEDFIEVLTSTTRPLDPYQGQTIFETDTQSFRSYTMVGWNSSPPVGSLLPYLGSTAPDGYLMANGAAVSRTGPTADLFGVVGTTYGNGDGINTFNLPNLNGRVPVGRDATQAEFDVLGEVGGAKTVVLTQAQMPLHVHGITDPTHNHGQTVHGHGNGWHGHGNDAHDHWVDDNETGSHRHGVGGSGAGAPDIIWRWGGSGEGLQGGSSGMRATGTSMDYAGSHNHDIDVGPNNINIHANTTGMYDQYAWIQAAGTGVTVNQAGSNEAHNNLQPYLTVNYIVKI